MGYQLCQGKRKQNAIRVAVSIVWCTVGAILSFVGSDGDGYGSDMVAVIGGGCLEIGISFELIVSSFPELFFIIIIIIGFWVSHSLHYQQVSVVHRG